MNSIICMVICSALTVGGQVLWKVSFNGLDFKLSLAFVMKVFSMWTFWLGTSLYVLATLLWFYALSKYDLSYIAPLMSLTYIFSLLAGAVVFHEVIGFTKVIGVCCIMMGAFLVTR